MESFEVLAAALAVGVVASLSAMVRRKALREAERSAWRTASIAIGLAPKRSELAQLGFPDTMEGTFEGVPVVVLRQVDETTGDGVLTVRTSIDPPLRLGLRLSSRQSSERGDIVTPDLPGTGLTLPVVQAHDADRAPKLIQRLRKKIEALRSDHDVILEDAVIALSSPKVGRAVELRADLGVLIAFRRAVEAAAKNLGEPSADAAIRASWEALAEGKDIEVSPGPLLRGTLRKLPITASLHFDSTSGTRSTEITLACPLPPAARFRALPNLGEQTNALLAQLMGAPRDPTPSVGNALLDTLGQIIANDPFAPPREKDAFSERFTVVGKVAPSEAVKNAMLRLDPRVTSVAGNADGLKLTAVEALVGEDLTLVVELGEQVAFVMMGQTSGDGAYRTP